MPTSIEAAVPTTEAVEALAKWLKETIFMFRELVSRKRLDEALALILEIAKVESPTGGAGLFVVEPLGPGLSQDELNTLRYIKELAKATNT